LLVFMRLDLSGFAFSKDDRTVFRIGFLLSDWFFQDLVFGFGFRVFQVRIQGFYFGSLALVFSTVQDLRV
jgi:hypothetical protein